MCCLETTGEILLTTRGLLAFKGGVVGNVYDMKLSDGYVYILQNGLEDEPIFKDGKFVGLMTDMEAAAKFGVGLGTVHAWIRLKWLDAFQFGDKCYIPANAKPRLEDSTDDNVVLVVNMRV